MQCCCVGLRRLAQVLRVWAMHRFLGLMWASDPAMGAHVPGIVRQGSRVGPLANASNVRLHALPGCAL